MNKAEARSAVMGAISMALKDSTLQQGFEVICKNLAELEKENAELKAYNEKLLESDIEKHNKIAELEKELEQAKKVQVVEHFEAYGQCRDSRRIASLETENVELKDKLKNLESVAEVRLANWQKYEQENAELKDQLTKAKDLIRNLLRVTYGEGWNYSLDVKVKAEDFLKECE